MQRRMKKHNRKQAKIIRDLERDAQVALVEMQAATGVHDRLIHHYSR